jgi:molybdate transport system substrate-binding protein
MKASMRLPAAFIRRALHLAFFVTACIGLPTLAVAENLLIGAGAGYRRPVAELSVAFEKKTGHHVEQIYGHPGGLVAQARESGKIEIIVGDKAYLSQVKDLPFAQWIDLGRGRMVFAWPRGGKALSAGYANAAQYKRIAIADPKAAIYGIAATEFIANAKLSDVWQGAIFAVSMVPQVSAYLANGEVDGGFVNLTEALGVADKIGGYQEVDQKLYTPIGITGAVISGFEDRAAVRAFTGFLSTPEASAILDKHGL